MDLDRVGFLSTPEGTVAAWHWKPPTHLVKSTSRGNPLVVLEVQPVIEPRHPPTEWLVLVFHVKNGHAWPTAWASRLSFARQELPVQGPPLDVPAEIGPIVMELIGNDTQDPGFWIVTAARTTEPAHFGVVLRALAGPAGPAMIGTATFDELTTPLSEPAATGSGFGAAIYHERHQPSQNLQQWTRGVSVERSGPLEDRPRADFSRTQIRIRSPSEAGYTLSYGFFVGSNSIGSVDLNVDIRHEHLTRHGPVIESFVPGARSASGFPTYQGVGDGAGASRVDATLELAQTGLLEFVIVQYDLPVGLEDLIGWPSLRDARIWSRPVDAVSWPGWAAQFEAAGAGAASTDWPSMR